MSLETEIKNGIASALNSLNVETEVESIALQPTREGFDGDFTFVTFPFVKQLRKAPDQVGNEIGTILQQKCDAVTGFNVVKGFLNIEVAQDSWLSLFNDILANDDFGKNPQIGKTVMVEYSSPNTNKPLHLGHLRNNFLGYAVAQILQENGYEVVMANLINDRGIHICKSMLGYLKFANGKTPEDFGLKGDRLVGDLYVQFEKAYKSEVQELIGKGMGEDQAKKEAPLFVEAQEMLRKWENNDKETVALWEKMNNWVYEGFDATYNLIGVNFDKFYYESDTYLLGKDLVDEGMKSGEFYSKEDNSVWCDLSDRGLDHKLVLRGDGTSVYITQDMGTADLKYNEYKLDQSLYVVGDEQDHHFQVLKEILKKLGRSYAANIYHLSYGMVDLPTGRMKTREGNVVDADDLVQEMIDTAKTRTTELGKIDGFNEEEAKQLYRILALGALKYYILKVDPRRRMVFNPEESIDFQGDTGVFIQFIYVRTAAILRKANSDGIDHSKVVASMELSETEQKIIELLNSYPKKLNEAASNYAPSVLAQYTYSLAKAYSKFYNESPIFHERTSDEQRQFRVALSYVVGRTLKKVLSLLGIECPERM